MTSLRTIVRTITRNPAFALAVIASLAVGIGVNTVMFTVVDTLLFRPPQGVHAPDRLLRVYFTVTGAGRRTTTSPLTSYPTLVDFRANISTAQAFAGSCQRVLPIGRGIQARQGRAEIVTANYFALLGVRPAIGRFFGSDSAASAGERTVVLSDALWRDQFAADPTVIGRTILIGADPYTIGGVAPREFNGLDLQNVRLWLPLDAAGQLCGGPDWRREGGYWLGIVGRVRPGVGTAAVSAAATQLYRQANFETADDEGATTVLLGPIQVARGPGGDDQARVSLWLAGVSLIILAVVSLNVAGLQLTRTLYRQPEIALRKALGATSHRITIELLTESVTLAVLGGVAAVLVAAAVMPLVSRLLLTQDGPALPVLNPRMLVLIGTLTLLAGIVSGLGPALRGGRLREAGVLASAGSSLPAQRSLRQAFLVAQVALTFTLVVGAGLFTASLRHVRSLHLGVAPDSVLVVTLDLEHVGMNAPDIEAEFQRVLERARTVPGLGSTSLGTAIPFRESAGFSVWIPRLTKPAESGTGSPYFNAVTPGYFATVGTRIIAGRDFTPADQAGAPLVAVVNETMARFLWPGESALGQCMHLGERDAPCVRVVGVAEDSHQMWIREESRMGFYIPLEQYRGAFLVRALFARARTSAATTIPLVRAAVQSVDPNLPFVTVQVLQDLIDPQTKSWRLGAAMFTGFGGLALVMASIGVYGLMMYVVRRRTREIGIRIAVGASNSRIIRAVIGETMAFTLLGAVIGAGAAVAIGRGMAGLLFGVSPSDPAVYAVALTVIGVVAAGASYVPAREATRVDPMLALKAE